MKSLDQSRVKIIDSLWSFFIALAILGPFALPLLWRNPRIEKRSKIVGTVFILVFTAGLLWFSGHFMAQLNDQFKELKTLQESSP